MNRKHPNRRWYQSPKLWWPIGIIATICLVVPLVFNISPVPGALLIRAFFTQNAAKMSEIMAPYAPKSGVDSVLNVAYLPDGDPKTTLDVYYPTGTDKPLGTVVWTHGGAWISGDKANDATYFEILASHGYTVIGLDYGYGPEAKFPTAVFQINDALAFIQQNADKFHVDTTRIVMAGDSAGGNLTSQLAALITNPEYAAAMEFTPALKPSQLKGLVLNCGVYDMASMIGDSNQMDAVHTASSSQSFLQKLLTWGDTTSLWAYTGDRDLGTSRSIDLMSTINFVTKDFPPVYITGGNADPLTEAQSKPMAARLQKLGVSVDSLFWPADYTPALPHEYQFRLDLEAAQTALTHTLDFLEARLGN
jgi:acetyl esterase/lipase